MTTCTGPPSGKYANIISGKSAEDIIKKVFQRLPLQHNQQDVIPIQTLLYSTNNELIPPNFSRIGQTNVYTLNRKINRRRDIIGFLIGNVVSTHMLAAFKYEDTLFCFDPHGDNRIPLSNHIFNVVKRLYGATKIQYYDGTNLQIGNIFGMCVGWSSEFLARIITTYYVGKMNMVENIITYKTPDLNSLIEVFNTLSLANQRGNISQSIRRMEVPKNYSVKNLNLAFNRLSVTNKYSKIVQQSLLNTRENTIFTRATNQKYFKELLPSILLKKIVKPKKKSKYIRVTKPTFKTTKKKFKR